MRKVFPPRFIHRLLGLLAEIPEMKGTADAALLARRIVALIQEEAQDPPRPVSNPSSPPGSDENAGEQDGDQRDSSEREPGEGARDGSGQEAAGNESGDRAEQGAPSDGNRTGESQGQAQSEEGDDGSQGTGQGDNDSEANPGGHGAGGEGGEGRKALQAVLSAGEGDVPRDVFGTVAEALSARSHGRSSVLLPTLEPYQGQPARGRATLSLVKAESAKLTTRLQGLVESYSMAQVRTARRGRALSRAHLHRLAVGDARVFQRTEQKAAPNTALHLLVDLSGSMCGGQDRIALDAAMAVALALEPMRGVSCAVTAFPSLRGAADSVTRILSHGDRIAARAGAFVQNARGSTPMTGALWYAAADLLARSEERKVILTLTDGEPDDRSSARTMVDRASAAGLELIGVGIGIGVDHLFPVSVRIDGIADLKNELFRIAEQLLLK
jgi:nitric oxide reductase activation protein